MSLALYSRLFAACSLLLAAAVSAATGEKIVDYSIDGKPYRGYYYADAAAKAPLPLVVLVPNWLGNSPANLKQAREIAGSDYAVFVADMYGKDHLPKDPAAAGNAVTALYGDRAELRKRIAAAKAEGLAYAQKNKLKVDTAKVAAIGFCFGGATVLELARTGDDLAAVVSFHGNLSLEAPAQNAPIRTRVLALHGDADPYVPAKQVDPFLEEMRASGADWQLVRYGGAVHSFTDPDANMPGQAMYDAKVARRAFAEMKDFLTEAFAAK